jgi:hypothetical protein
MAQLTKAEAARQLGIARSTLYKLIDQGKVSPTPDGFIDQAELVRVAAYVDTLTGRLRTSEGIHDTPAQRHAETPHRRPHTDDHEHPRTDVRERPQTSADVLVDILREQIQVLRDELQETRAERQAAREREVYLLRLVEQMQQRYDRLLGMPRSAPVVSPAHAPQAARPLPAQRGDMRRRILALLRDHPAGLTPAQVRQLLDVAKPLAHTMRAMVRDGLLRRVETGIYVSV